MAPASDHREIVSTSLDTSLRARDAGTALMSAAQYLRDGLVSQAEAALRWAVAIDAGSARGHAALALLLHRQGKLSDSERMARQAVRLVPQEEAVHRILGTILETRGRLDEAGECYATALTIAPDSALARAARGSIYLRRGRVDDAEMELSIAIELDPDDPTTLFDLAELAYQRDDLAGLVARLEAARVLLEDPRRAPVLRHGALLVRADLDRITEVCHRRLARARALMAEFAPQAGAGVPVHGAHQPAARVAGVAVVGTVDAGDSHGPNAWEDAAPAPRAAGSDDHISRLEALVDSAPDDRRLRRLLSAAYLREGRLAEAKDQLRRAEDLLSRQRLRIVGRPDPR